MQKEPFTIAIPEEALTDLRERLTKVRWPVDFANDQWQYGTNLGYLKELVDYWLHGYDWRVHERTMNAFSHYKTTIEGVPIHFIHEPGKGPNPTPLILSHGWPWTFWDFHKVIRPLSDPAFGGDPKDAFDVIVPSLPGYGFSTLLTTPGINFWRTADLWVKLMQDVSDTKIRRARRSWGAIITAQLGHKYADRMIGCHMNLMVPLDIFVGVCPKRQNMAQTNRVVREERKLLYCRKRLLGAANDHRPQTMHMRSMILRWGCARGSWRNGALGVTAAATWKTALRKMTCSQR
jgi:pimeloyl-ACP methyl ester carboxylesterase